MVSNLKSETARANGAKSRGPTTPEGKEKSSRNALKHGLTAGSGNILLDSEDPDECEEIFNRLLGIHEPARPAEKDLVEEMGVARWRIRRIRTVETGLLNAEILTQAAKSDTPDPAVHLASAYRSLSDDSHSSLALASRYEARLQRTYDRAYKTLRELQQARKAEPPEQPHTIKVMWVDSQEELDMRAAAAQPAPPNPSSEPDPTPGSTAPSVSEGEREPIPSSEPAPKTKLPNEPTGDATKGVNNESSDEGTQPPSAQHPKSNIQHPFSNPNSDVSRH